LTFSPDPVYDFPALEEANDMSPQRTLPQLFEDSVARFSDKVMMLEKKTDAYEGTTYAQMRERVHLFAAGLVSLGIRPGDRMSLIADGRNDWVMSELGMFYVGAVDVPISVKIEDLADLTFRLSHSGCRAVVVTQSQIEKIRKIKKNLPELEMTIVLDELKSYEPDEIPVAAVLARGAEFLARDQGAVDARWRAVREDDPANICYTSGTTSDPKGIILTHRNYTANIEQSLGLVRFEPGWCALIFLPWDHAFAHTCGLYTLFSTGGMIASTQRARSYMDSLKNIVLNIKETRPHVLMSVPTIAKNFRKGVEKGIRDKGPKAEALFKKALKTAYAYHGDGWDRGKGLRKLHKPALALFDRLIFRKIRANFGGRIQYIVGGGALLDIELQRFFCAVGMPMYQGYGLTEAAPVISANSGECHKFGSSGRVAPGIELRICDEKGDAVPAGQPGEIVIRGENVMAGYWKNERATRETLRDGWLFTGDLGYLDADGFLYVLGRAKSLLIADDGEKYSPEGIEETITEKSRFIDQLMLYNNQSPFTVALVVPNKEALLRAVKEKGLSLKTRDGREAALRLIEGEIALYRDGGAKAGMFPSRWLPAATAVLGEPFTEENRMLNSQLKMVRGKITAFYKTRLDHLFTAEAKDIVNAQNLTIAGRFE
jgi:long-chain acyl-CoA synthetase